MDDVIATGTFEPDPNKLPADAIVKTLALVSMLERQIKSVETFAGMCAIDLKAMRTLLERYQQEASLSTPLTERSTTMSYNVISTITVGGKPAAVRSWSGLEKGHVIDKFEKGLIKVLSQMNTMSSDKHSRKAAAPPKTNPATVIYNLSITKDGQPWASSTLEWPGMPEEDRVAAMKFLDDTFNGMGKDVTSKEAKRTP